ncbi:MAG: hypothetical protein AB1486_27175 [Planctomycetota bacterium]
MPSTAEVIDQLPVCVELVALAKAPLPPGRYTATGNLFVELLEHQPARLEPPVQEAYLA